MQATNSPTRIPPSGADPASDGEPPPAGPGSGEAVEGSAAPWVAEQGALAVDGLAAPAAGLFAALLAGALCSSVSASLLRVLPTSLDAASVGREASAEIERHLGVEFERTERLAASASVAAFVFRAMAIACAALLVSAVWAPGPLALVAVTALVGGALVHLTTQSIPLAFAQSRADRLLVAVLPVVAPALRPFEWIAAALTWMRRPILRVLGTPDADHGTRRLVEGFRAIVEEAELRGDLGENTQELIANVIEFSGADAAEVMTPRTEVRAIELDQPLSAAVAVFAEHGFSRIPVFRESIDTIVGTLTALEAAKAVREDRLEATRIGDVMRPPLLVPETKLVPELLSDFRRERQKMAIVVDEYGGTAGLVTLADVMAEVLGDVQDEFAADEARFTPMECGATNADASLHVSEINEELGLDLPEEADYETLAGFVLSELGRFPRTGETFERGGVGYEVLEASDRRVLRVAIRPPGASARPGVAAEGGGRAASKAG